MTDREKVRKLEDRVKFMYLHHQGRVLTIAREYDRESNSVTYGYALCCEKDQFSRHIGRKVAYNRLEFRGCIVSCGDKRAIDVSIEAIANEVGFLQREGYLSPAHIAIQEMAKRAEAAGVSD